MEQPRTEVIRRLPSPRDPRGVARVFAGAKYMVDGLMTLRHWRGGWWRWKKTHWAEIAVSEVENGVWNFTDGAVYTDKNNHDVPWLPKRHTVGDVVRALQSISVMDDITDAPFWLDGRKTGLIVACSNGLLDIASKELLRHTPYYFNLNSVPFAYNPKALCPEFDRFIGSLWEEHDDTRRTLAQMLGYLVSGRTDLQCMFGLIGPRRAGKSTIARVATLLLGKGNVAALTQANLGEQFGLEHVVGKSLATISDARTSGKNAQTVVERLLSITGEDALPVARKYKTAWQGRLPTRIMILSNELPHFGDASTAIAHRFIILPFLRSFEGMEDRALETKLTAELPGILNFVLDGLVGLERDGRFVQSEEARRMVDDIADLSSPLRLFLREECDLGPGFRVGKDALYQRYRGWAQRNGLALLAVNAFARALIATTDRKVTSARTRVDGKREHVYDGIQLKTASCRSSAEQALHNR